MNTVIVTGFTGQIGCFISQKCLDRGDKVVGMARYIANSSEKLKERSFIIDHENFTLASGSLEDQSSLDAIVREHHPDAFINCAAMSHVGESWRIPEATANITGIGVLRCLESIRKYAHFCKFIQCSSSEMFGGELDGKLDEDTPLKARSPYSAAKIFAHQMVNVYRESYDIWASAAIMFNNESEYRDKSFFTRKITSQMGEILSGERDKIQLGNLMFKRDWGYSGDYADAILLMLNNENPSDYVISTGECHTGKEFIDLAFKIANEEIGREFFTFEKHIESDDPDFLRPNDLHYLCGDSGRVKADLSWKPILTFAGLVSKMVKHDVIMPNRAYLDEVSLKRGENA